MRKQGLKHNLKHLKEFKQFYDQIYIHLSESSAFTSRHPWEKVKALERLDSVLETILQVTKNKDTFSLLDVGCAEGWLLDKINNLNLHAFYVGVDVSSANINKAKLKKNGNWVLCDAENLPFKNDAFQIVICSEVLEHVLHPQKCLNEIQRVVQYYVILTTPVVGSPILLDMLRYNNLALKNSKQIRSYFKTYGTSYVLKKVGSHINCFTLSILRKLYSKYFTEIFVKGISFNFPLLIYFLKIFPLYSIQLHMKLQKRIFKHLPLFSIALPIGNEFAIILLRKIRKEKRINKRLISKLHNPYFPRS
jgi:ubiquinone/menaquinone biosynthesis C-methylase UbiE